MAHTDAVLERRQARLREIGERLEPTYKEDTNRIICLVPFICRLTSGPIILTEHAQYKWLTMNDLPSVDWAEADLGVIETYKMALDCELYA